MKSRSVPDVRFPAAPGLARRRSATSEARPPVAACGRGHGSRLGLAALAAAVLSAGLAGSALATGPSPGRVPGPATRLQVEPRDVLILYSGAAGTSPGPLSLPWACQVVIQHLGLRPRFHDVARALPPDGMEGLRGILTLFREEAAVPDPAGYCRWLRRQAARKVPIVILGSLGAHGGGVDPWEVRKTYLTLGWDWGGAWAGDPERLAWSDPHEGWFGFEAPLSRHPATWSQAQVVDRSATVLLRSRRTDTGQEADVASISGRGAVVLGLDAVLAEHRDARTVQWRVDPFRLFERAFSTEGAPRFDPTTISGRRAFYSHIDGDGLFNRSWLPGGQSCGRIVLENVIRRVGVPVTVSVIAGELGDRDDRIALAKRIFAEPNVEAASHTWSHPFRWADPRFAGPTRSPEAWDGSQEPVDLAREIDGSIEAISRLLPPGKRVEAYLLSGDAAPGEEALRRIRERGVAVLGGGDSRVTHDTPSIWSLAPWVRLAGAETQVLAGAAGDHALTNQWLGPFDGFAALPETLRFQGAPRRLAAADIYYHFYSGERPGSLAAVLANYRWAAAQPLTPVPASRYVRGVVGSLEGTAERLADGVWRLRGYGPCRTVRFDGRDLALDLARSRNVAGAVLEGGSLWVTLGAGEAVVALGRPAARQPHLIEANADLIEFDRPPGGFRVRFRSWVPLAARFGGFRPGAGYRVAVARERAQQVRADRGGTVRVQSRAAGVVAVSISPVEPE